MNKKTPMERDWIKFDLIGSRSAILRLLALFLLLCCIQAPAASNHYEVLDVAKSATEKEIKAAFRREVMKWHPDKNTDPKASEKFRAIIEAEQVLGDPEKRRTYDQSLKEVPPDVLAQSASVYRAAQEKFDQNFVLRIYSLTKAAGDDFISFENTKFAADLIAANYAKDAQRVSALVRKNLLKDRVSQLLVRSTVIYFSAQFGERADHLIELLVDMLNAEIRARSRLYNELPDLHPDRYKLRTEATALSQLLKQVESAQRIINPEPDFFSRLKAKCEKLLNL